MPATLVKHSHIVSPIFPDGEHCPGCGGLLERVHRHRLDRLVSMFRSVHRYRCIDPDCGWEGVVGREEFTLALVAAMTWRSRLLWLAGGVLLAGATMVGMRMLNSPKAAPKPVAAASAAARTSAPTAALDAPAGLGDDVEGATNPVVPGLHHEGITLASADERVKKNPTPLHLRRSCVWGVPGRTPYRGTVEQALMAAQLPPEVVRRVSEMAQNGFTKDRVEISRTAIRSIDGRRIFKPVIPAMGFGDSMCFETRVNFPAGHVEYAALYEAEDRSGKTYSVMVPFVCNNVSVLGVRAERDVPNGQAPEPASWTLVAGVLAVLAGLRRRTLRRQA